MTYVYVSLLLVDAAILLALWCGCFRRPRQRMRRSDPPHLGGGMGRHHARQPPAPDADADND